LLLSGERIKPTELYFLSKCTFNGKNDQKNKKRNKKKFVEYLNDMRIAQACKYLMETDWSISEVAYACGYKSVSNFNKLFKETKNCCPKAFRVQFDK
jgi:AraC-like DNA-binding protein